MKTRVDDFMFNPYIMDSVEAEELRRWGKDSCLWEVASIGGGEPLMLSYSDVGICFDRKGKCGKVRFWQHLANFPMHRRDIPQGLEDAFLSALAFGTNEHLGENTTKTNFPFDASQIRQISDVYLDLKARQEQSNVIPSLIYHIASVMSTIELAREKSKAGTSEARIYRDLAIPTPTTQMRILDYFLSVLSFGTHASYRKRLQSTVPKGELRLPEFRRLMIEMVEEWTDSNLLGTVFVSANVSLLAVPGINGLQTTACLASAIFSLLSVAAGVHCVWKHRRHSMAQLSDAQYYLSYDHLGSHDFDLTITGCLLAVPISSLLWSVIFLTVTLSALGIEASTSILGDTAAKLLAADDNSTLIITGILISLCTIVGAAMLFFFWKLWRAHRRTEIEDDYKLDITFDDDAEEEDEESDDEDDDEEEDDEDEDEDDDDDDDDEEEDGEDEDDEEDDDDSEHA